jgi:TonB family protein
MLGAFEHIEEHVPASDRRTHSRQPVRSLAYVELDEGNGGIVLNVSEGGLSVQAVMSLMEDSLPRMRFQLSESKDWLETSARIAWTNESRKVAGLQFVDLPEQARRHIREWLIREGVAATPDEHHEPATVPAPDRGTGVIEEKLAAARVVPPSAGASMPAPPSASAYVFEQTSEFDSESQPLPGSSPDANRSEHAWNLAGVLALLAIASLLAGWIAGRGTFSALWEKIRETAPSAQRADSASSSTVVMAPAPVSEIEVVDIHNQRWMIPFSPAASGDQVSANGRRQAQPREWLAFDPTVAAPKIQSRPVADSGDSQKPNPPVVAAPSENAGTVPLPSESAVPRDLRPPAPKEEPPTGQLTGVLQRGALIYHVNPVYPELARDQDIQGTVKLRVTIGENGVVRSVIAISGPGMLIEAARSAVRQWRYTPTLLDGKPIESQEDVSIVFQLPSASR